MTNSKKLDNYIIIKRELKSDYLNGKINRDELFMIIWIRLSANPYGLATVNMNTISEDVFNLTKNVNQINKIFLNLKRHRYLYYKTRSGSRGSFEVHLPDFILPNTGNITDINKYYKDDKNKVCDSSISEVEQSFDDVKQSLNTSNKLVNSDVLADFVEAQSRADNNDTDTRNDNEIEIETENEKNRSATIKKRIQTFTHLFQPETLEESQCKNIAIEIGEVNMTYPLSIIFAASIYMVIFLFTHTY